VDRYTAKYILKGKVLEINRSLYTQHSTMVCGPDENKREKKFFPVFQRDMRAQVIYE
jgi:heat shock protein HslJ